jgi:hypothetical protein
MQGVISDPAGSFGMEPRQLREQAGLSPEQLAERLGLLDRPAGGQVGEFAIKPTHAGWSYPGLMERCGLGGLLAG